MTPERAGTGEVLAATCGACSLLLLGATWLYLRLTDVPDGLDALGYGFVAVLGVVLAGVLAAVASVGLAVHLVRHGLRLRPWTWVLGVGPALVGGYLLVGVVLDETVR